MQTQRQENPIIDRLDALARDAIAEKRIVGGVIVAFGQGRLAHRAAYGLADREAGRATRVDDIFRFASLTKPIVTAAAMGLIEQGKLSLDGAVTDWLPDFRPKLADGFEPAITIHHLLTHTAGLTYQFMQGGDGPYNRLKISNGMDQPGLSMDEELRRLADAPLVYRPGEGWGYSNALDVVGAVLEKAAGKRLADIVTHLVTRPLGMKDTGFAPPKDPLRLAFAYGDASPEPKLMVDGDGQSVVPGNVPCWFAPSRIFDETSFASGGAGMSGTADDMARFLEAIRTGGDPILRRESAKAMMTHQIGDQRMNFVPGGGWGFGYGGAVLLDAAKGQSVLSPGAWRWGGAYGANWFVDRARELTVVALTNTGLEGMSGRFAQEQPAAAVG